MTRISLRKKSYHSFYPTQSESEMIWTENFFKRARLRTFLFLYGKILRIAFHSALFRPDSRKYEIFFSANAS